MADGAARLPFAVIVAVLAGFTVLAPDSVHGAAVVALVRLSIRLPLMRMCVVRHVVTVVRNLQVSQISQLTTMREKSMWVRERVCV